MIDPASLIFPMLLTIILLICILALMVLKLRRERSNHAHTQYQLDSAITRNADLLLDNLALRKRLGEDTDPEDILP